MDPVISPCYTVAARRSIQRSRNQGVQIQTTRDGGDRNGDTFPSFYSKTVTINHRHYICNTIAVIAVRVAVERESDISRSKDIIRLMLPPFFSDLPVNFLPRTTFTYT